MRGSICRFTALSIIACCAIVPAAAANTRPDFAPDSGTAWVARGQDFLPPSSGPGPVMADPKRPRVTNDDLRAGTGQPCAPQPISAILFCSHGRAMN